MWVCGHCYTNNENDSSNCSICNREKPAGSISNRVKKTLQKFAFPDKGGGRTNEFKPSYSNQKESTTSYKTDKGATSKYELKPDYSHQKVLMTSYETDIDRSGIAANERRYVLIGKTGTGKSATANTILGSEGFISKLKGKSVTSECKMGTAERFGRKIVIVDTPGLFDTGMTNEKVTKEIVKCVGMTSPGPHAILLVVSVGRFTKEEQETVSHFVDHFGKDMYAYLYVIFTRKDDLEREHTTIEEYVREVPDELKEILKQCSNRYTAFNNTLKGKESENQAESLINNIDRMVTQNGGLCYSNDMYKEAEKALIERQEKIKKQLEEEKQREIKAIENEMSKKFEKQFEKSKAENQKLETQITMIQLQSQNTEQRANALQKQIEDLKIEHKQALKKADKQAEERITAQMEQVERQFKEQQRKLEIERAEKEKHKEQEKQIQMLQNLIKENERTRRNEEDAKRKAEIEEMKRKKEMEMEYLKQQHEAYRQEQEKKAMKEREEKIRLEYLQREKEEAERIHAEEMERIREEQERQKIGAETKLKKKVEKVRDTTRKEVEEENSGIFGAIQRGFNRFTSWLFS